MGCILNSSNIFPNVKIVLVETSHPGNIGAVMRSMETMGLVQLVLVNPKIYPHPDVDARASNASIALNNVTVVQSLDEALQDCQLVLGASARNRKIAVPLVDARDCGKLCLEYKQSNIAIVFGPERTGLTNEQLIQCNFHVHIPANEHYQALNIAAAVQVICYELRMAKLSTIEKEQEYTGEPLADYNDMLGMYKHLEQMLCDVDFLDQDNPKKLMVRLKRMFNRIKLEKTEVNILRGIINSISKA